MLYLLSFVLLLIGETMGIFRDFCVIHNKKQIAALLNAFNTMFWCIKIYVVIDQPLTIVTAGLGSYFGTIIAFKLGSKLQKNS